MRRATWIAAAAGVLGTGLWIVGLVAEPRRALLAWLFAFTFGVTIALGALVLVLLTDVAGARWFLVLRPTATAAAATLPAFLVLFGPILVSSTWLYAWASPPTGATEHVAKEIDQMRRWLTPGAFAVRAVLYLALWSALAVLVRRPASEATRRKIGGVATLLVALTASWASFEWIMSLNVGWGSTVFGMYFCSAAFLAGASVVAVGAWLERRRGVLPDDVKPDHFHALGRLVLVGVCLWAYTEFSQLLVIWIGDLPKEVPFYLARTRGAWTAFAWVLVLGHFVAPFLALLLRPLKRSPQMLGLACVWLLVMHACDMAWLVLPAYVDRPAPIDLAALAGVTGLATAVGLRVFAARDALPRFDPELGEALRYHSP